jgi:hypothetical protein
MKNLMNGPHPARFFAFTMLRLLRNKTFTPCRILGQLVIPGEQGETRNPGKAHWIPACAGMTQQWVSPFMLSACALDNSQ